MTPHLTTAHEWRGGAFSISTDQNRLDAALIHRFLSEESYWAQGRPRAVVEKAIRHSLCFGVYCDGRQIGFARVVSDFATFAWLADVFILPEFRGQGLSKQLLSVIAAHPELQGLRRWILSTRDAHTLYSRYGFTPLHGPELFMEKLSNPPDCAAVRP